jgi:hypothetical protein
MDEPMTPVVEPVSVGMDFPDAIRKVIEGKRIARTSWGNADYGVLKDGFLVIFHKKEEENLPDFHTWLVNDGDLQATDWIVLPDIN